MERRYALTLHPGERVAATFALMSKEIRAARTGEAYLSLELADRSGRIPGIMFRPTREAEAVPVGLVVQVRGVVTAFRGVVRVTVESLRAAEEYDPRDIVPTGVRDTSELLTELRGLVRIVADASLGALLREVFGDVVLMTRFKESPACPGGHHAYLGGLLEHTVGVASVCRQIAALHPQIDADLLLTGALLHDIGAVDAVAYATGIDHTDEGRLLGHAVLGERRVHGAIGRLVGGFPAEQALHLAHMVLTHHGQAATPFTGSPATLESLTLHHADTLDSETAGFIDVATRASMVGETWTDGENAFGRRLRTPGVGYAFVQTAPSEVPGLARSA
ncbi:MAG: HD domain-containing protein [Coriobacteriia bacterium]|nr:HD domain-containing protein [Coriobacteriia bacterium]